MSCFIVNYYNIFMCKTSIFYNRAGTRCEEYIQLDFDSPFPFGLMIYIRSGFLHILCNMRFFQELWKMLLC